MSSLHPSPDSNASFDALVAPHRSALLAHCYRMTGSLPDAEDALQDALLRAWRGWDRFEGRSSLRTWLFRIATNTSRRVIEQRRRRILPIDFGPPSDPHSPRDHPFEEGTWITPFPTGPRDGSPAGSLETKESVELAFIAALQTLPGRQRAVLLLRDVLGFTAAETSEALDSSVPSVNSALHRARAAMASREQTSEKPGLDAAGTRAAADRFVAAWVANDVGALVALLAADVEMTMPPIPTWFRGIDDVAEFLRVAPLAGQLRWEARPMQANGQPSFALYSHGDAGWEAHSLNVLTFDGDRVAGFDAFLTPDLFPAFGLPTLLLS